MKKGYWLSFFLALVTSAHAADSVSIGAPPPLSPNIGVPGTGCSGVGTQGVTTAGVPLSCQNGIWNMLGISNAEWVSQYTYIDGWPLPTIVMTAVQCPPGKRVVSGGCNFNGFSTDVNLDESFPEAGMTSWRCAVKVRSLTETNPLTGVEASAICANYSQ